MTNVEEMIDGFEWSALQVDLETMLAPNTKANAVSKGRSRGAADQIEGRLQDELSALEKANIHSFLESDDRVLAVMKLIDDTITVIDDLDGYMSSYKVQLNVCGSYPRVRLVITNHASSDRRRGHQLHPVAESRSAGANPESECPHA